VHHHSRRLRPAFALSPTPCAHVCARVQAAARPRAKGTRRTRAWAAHGPGLHTGLGCRRSRAPASAPPPQACPATARRPTRASRTCGSIILHCQGPRDCSDPLFYLSRSHVTRGRCSTCAPPARSPCLPAGGDGGLAGPVDGPGRAGRTRLDGREGPGGPGQARTRLDRWTGEHGQARAGRRDERGRHACCRPHTRATSPSGPWKARASARTHPFTRIRHAASAPPLGSHFGAAPTHPARPAPGLSAAAAIEALAWGEL
jgi:hypothetical protein